MDADLFFILLTITATVGAVASLALRRNEKVCAAVSFSTAGLAAR